MLCKFKLLKPCSKQWEHIQLGFSLLLFCFLTDKECDCSHEAKRCLLPGRKVMTNLDSILKSRDITLSTKVRPVKAMVFPVVIYGCELDSKES